ncbi:tetraacyldisaccharide 4'-kinase [Piscinibacter sakaiensis]|uniref:tetraacyldisaccharide 4'-kinase n=1 Tax=Piscinibacter sakaiensis TaxID=1547922 RepID=UPI003AB02206
MRRGPLACLLWPLSLLMRLIVATRRAAYRFGLLRSGRLPVPVLVVGNLIVGGAGKTPVVIAVVELLRAAGHRPAIVSRGYGRGDDSPLAVAPQSMAADAGDEPLLLRLRCQVPVWVGRDRQATARALLEQHPHTSVIVCDDGLQHLALQRDLQLVVFDERGAGNGWLLPAGPLREPLPADVSRLNGVATLVVYNAAKPTTRLPGSRVDAGLRGAVALAAWWRGEAASPAILDGLRGRPLLAAAGTARPQRFFAMLRAAGLQINELPLPDHFGFSTLPWPEGTTDVLLTEKDAVKVDPHRLGDCRAWVVPLDLQLEPELADQIRQALPPGATAANQDDPDHDGHTTA